KNITPQLPQTKLHLVGLGTFLFLPRVANLRRRGWRPAPRGRPPQPLPQLSPCRLDGRRPGPCSGMGGHGWSVRPSLIDGRPYRPTIDLHSHGATRTPDQPRDGRDGRHGGSRTNHADHPPDDPMSQTPTFGLTLQGPTAQPQVGGSAVSP